eukprot:scaffold2382_cov184-Ochromonas_danica.AAC.5
MVMMMMMMAKGDDNMNIHGSSSFRCLTKKRFNIMDSSPRQQLAGQSSLCVSEMEQAEDKTSQ